VEAGTNGGMIQDGKLSGVPETIIGRPRISAELRNLIGAMSLTNHPWGAPPFLNPLQTAIGKGSPVMPADCAPR
jgi:hypothetical protein